LTTRGASVADFEMNQYYNTFSNSTKVVMTRIHSESTDHRLLDGGLGVLWNVIPSRTLAFLSYYENSANCVDQKHISKIVPQ